MKVERRIFGGEREQMGDKGDERREWEGKKKVIEYYTFSCICRIKNLKIRHASCIYAFEHISDENSIIWEEEGQPNSR